MREVEVLVTFRTSSRIVVQGSEKIATMEISKTQAPHAHRSNVVQSDVTIYVCLYEEVLEGVVPKVLKAEKDVRHVR